MKLFLPLFAFLLCHASPVLQGVGACEQSGDLHAQIKYQQNPGTSDPFRGVIDEGDFNIIFHQDFEHHQAPIEYATDLWNPDWRYPGWRDGDHRWPSWFAENIKDSIVTDPETGSRVMKFNFKDTLVDGYSGVSPFRGGDYWKVSLGGEYKELYLSYNVKFKPGWKWNQGGKLPATNGGTPLDKVTQDECIRPGEGEGYSSAVMWKDYGGLAFYLFYQEQPNEQWGETILWNDYQPAGLDYDPQGRFIFNTLEKSWYNITIRVVINSFTNGEPNKDGIMEGFINGKLIESVTGLYLLTKDDINKGVNEIALGHFFGGNENYQGPLRDEWSLLDDFVCFTYAEHMEVPRGNVPSAPDRILELPSSKTGSREISDTEAPSIPGNLKATSVSGRFVTLAWEHSVDNISVEGYRIYLSGEAHSTSKGNTSEVEGLNPNTQYAFSVSAFDASENESNRSDQLLVSTLELDSVPPTAPFNLTVTGSTENSIHISWNGSSDNENLTGYYLYLNGVRMGTTPDTVYSVTGLEPDTEYTFSVSAYDSSENESQPSYSITSRTRVEDLMPPSIPDGLMASLVTANSISIKWNPSADNVGVAGYHIMVNGILKGNTNVNSFIVNGLYPGIDYLISVAAYDAANNSSNYSPTLHISTKNPDEGVSASLPLLEVRKLAASKSANIVQAVTSLQNFAYTELLDYGVLLKKKVLTMVSRR